MIVERIERFVTTGQGDFEELSRAAFAFQYESIELFRRLCEARGVTPDSVTSWRDVPAVPASAFKSLELAAAPAREVFRSSGTTRGEAERSVHHHPYPDLYRAVVDASFPRYCLAPSADPGDGPVPMLSLVPSREQVPDSSLAFMVDHVLERFGAEGSAHGFGPSRVDTRTVRSWLGARQRDGRPGLLLTTGLALAQLLEGLAKFGLRFRLPSGSALFETGGTKGYAQEVSRADLLARAEEFLGIPPSSVVSEYGMTELTSQCYSETLLQARSPDPSEPPRFVAPPWVRVRILDPETLDQVANGEDGLVTVFDLANVGSAIHLLTEDRGRRDGDAFRLLGRAAGAELRGCSLTVEEMERT